MGQHDAIVVGAGYWGVAISYALRAAGLDVLALDAREPQASSANSAGIFQRWWYKADTSAKKMPDWFLASAGPSVDWLDALGLVTQVPEAFESYQGKAPTLREDCYLVTPASVLSLVKVEQGKVASVSQTGDGWLVIWEDTLGWRSTRSAAVVVAAGVWTDKILLASGRPVVGVKPLRGRAGLWPRHHLGKAPQLAAATYLAAPYQHYTMRTYGPFWRLGDTVEQTLDATELPQGYRKALDYFEFDAAQAVKWHDGLRPVTRQYIVEELAPGLVVATGGHRVGLGLAEPVAKRVKALLLKERVGV